MRRRLALACVVLWGSGSLVRAEHLGEWERTLAGLAEPVDAAYVDDELWVLERASGRIVVFDTAGETVRSFACSAELLRPNAFALGEDRLYIADTGHDRICIVTLAGESVGAWGRTGVEAGAFRRPLDVAVVGDRVLVADTDNHRVQLFTLDGEWLRTLGGRGAEGGSFDRPVSVAGNRRGEIYVADRRNHRLQRFAGDGRFLASFGARGTAPGLFLGAGALTWAGGRLFATDTLAGRVQVFDLHGRLLYLWGHEPAAAGEHEGALHEPAGIAVDEQAARAAVCEPLEGRVQVFTTETGGADHEPHDFDHDPLPAYGPGGALVGSRLALIDRLEATVAVFDVESIGLVRLGTLGGFGTSLGRFIDPQDVAIDGEDRSILVTDAGQRRITRFRLNAEFPAEDPRVATTVRSRAFESSPGLGEHFSKLGQPFEPGPIATGSEGRLWVADARAGVLVQLSSQFAVLDVVVDEGGSMGRFVDLAWHADERCLYAVLDEPRSVVVFDSEGARQREIALARPWDPRSVAVATNGDVIVADAARQCVLALRSDAVVRELGQFGWQPGHFAGIDAAFPCADRLYVLDRRQRRGQVLTSEGRFLVAFGHGH